MIRSHGLECDSWRDRWEICHEEHEGHDTADQVGLALVLFVPFVVKQIPRLREPLSPGGASDSIAA